VKRSTVTERAFRATRPYVSFTRTGGAHLWIRGHAAGMRDARKRFDAQLKDAERRIREAEALTAEYKRRRDEAVNEANRRASIIQSRLPATNGGYG